MSDFYERRLFTESTFNTRRLYTCTRCKVDLEIVLQPSRTPGFEECLKESDWAVFDFQGELTTLCPECAADSYTFLHGSEEWQHVSEE